MLFIFKYIDIVLFICIHILLSGNDLDDSVLDARTTGEAETTNEKNSTTDIDADSTTIKSVGKSSRSSSTSSSSSGNIGTYNNNTDSLLLAVGIPLRSRRIIQPKIKALKTDEALKKQGKKK